MRKKDNRNNEKICKEKVANVNSKRERERESKREREKERENRQIKYAIMKYGQHE
jgi:hypothetical protein